MISDEDWAAAVGAIIAEKTRPAYEQPDGTLVVHTPDPIWAFELGHHADDITGRLPGRPKLKFREGPFGPVASAKTKRDQYADYLESPHWRSLRLWALERADHRCQVCNTDKGRLHVHHRTYDRVGAELPSDLIVLCEECHATFHETGRLA